MSDTYRVFKRRPWRKIATGWEPHGGARKSTVARGQSLDQARALCEEGNRENRERAREGYSNVGRMWYEFEREA